MSYREIQNRKNSRIMYGGTGREGWVEALRGVEKEHYPGWEEELRIRDKLAEERAARSNDMTVGSFVSGEYSGL